MFTLTQLQPAAHGFVAIFDDFATGGYFAQPVTGYGVFRDLTQKAGENLTLALTPSAFTASQDHSYVDREDVLAAAPTWVVYDPDLYVLVARVSIRLRDDYAGVIHDGQSWRLTTYERAVRTGVAAEAARWDGAANV